MNVLSKLLVGSLVIGASHAVMGMDRTIVNPHDTLKELTRFVDTNPDAAKGVNKASNKFFHPITPDSRTITTPSRDDQKSPLPVYEEENLKLVARWNKVIEASQRKSPSNPLR